MSFHVPNMFRIPSDPVTLAMVASRPAIEAQAILANEAAALGNNGSFVIPIKIGAVKTKQRLYVIASDGMGWEHVSVIRNDRIPTWEEMCTVKEIFWDAEDVVVQYHPAASQYVNNHPHCLHLWRPTDAVMPCPPALLVGMPGVTPAQAQAMAGEGA